MARFANLFAVLCVVGFAAPAAARCRYVAVNVAPGQTVVGYVKHRRHCDPIIAPAPVQYVQAPQVYAPPPPPAYAPPAVYVAPPPPPVVYSAPPVVYATPAPAPVVVQQRAVKPERPRPGFLALKYMPGVSSTVAAPDGHIEFGQPGFTHSPGLEFRLARWFSLRSDLEFRQQGWTWDMLGAKVSLFPSSPVKPYASVSASMNENHANPGKFSFGFAAAAGLDVFFGKHFFLEAEARYRMTPGACCTEVPTLTGVIGGGVAFF
ncbi:MAG: hypothetical protein ACO1OB_22890 [Archangium sp.]